MARELLVCVLPPVLFAAPWGACVSRALVLLVVACPSALVFWTPVSIVAAIAAAARHGVLIKESLYVELPARLRAIAIDKAGTLTTGRPRLIGLLLHGEKDEATVLRRAAALEACRENPLARALVAYVEDRGIPVFAAENHRAVPGKGGGSIVDGESFWIGSRCLLAEQGLEAPAVREQIEWLSDLGQSILALGTASRVCGSLAVSDTVRPGALCRGT